MLDLTTLARVPTTNFGGPREVTDLCVWHNTAGGTMRSSMIWVARVGSTSGFHFGIERNGQITVSTPWDRIAWHAGESAWPVPAGGVPAHASVNKRSIGIEFANMNEPSGKLAFERISERQLAAAMDLVQALAARYPKLRTVAAHVRHRDIAPGRKTDPHPDTLDWVAFQARLVPHLVAA